MNYPHFVGPSYVSQNPIADQEELWNFYPERMESQGATASMVLQPVPGTVLLDTAPNGPGRGHIFDTSSGREFAVFATSFCEISSGGTITVLGTVGIDGNPATLSSNGDGGGQIFITSGGNGYNFDLATNTLTAITALAGKATVGAQLDGYFLCLDVPNSTLWVSDLLDGTTWDPTQFTQRSIEPDPWVAMVVAYRYIYLLGARTSEIWYDAGSFPFPFAPYPSGLLQYGCAATFSATVLNGNVYWLGSGPNGDGHVLKTSGFAVQTVSTKPVQYWVGTYSVIDNAIGDAYEDDGHGFYNLTFPTANVTWSFDDDEELWHKRGYWSSFSGSYSAWRPIFHALAFGQHRMLDLNNGGLYKLTDDSSTDVDGSVIRRVRRAPALVFENRRLQYASFELLMEVGNATASGQGSDPQVSLRMSNDGGMTWGSEVYRSAGKRGEYLTRVRWTRLGQARKRAFEVIVTDPIPWRIVGAVLEMPNAPQKVQAA